ncbi:Protein unc-93 A [Araneus ventricosus]|uniref:Protein unc-93 A n=1 Tax=Araneus ventricosus TaxID=182803 RepID=A0A4Y2A9J5_ARAVE|nr:Protein unc-93 A [Araneus ventricosus]
MEKSNQTKILSKSRIVKNLIVLSSSYLLLSIAYEGLIILQTTMNKEKGIGTASAAVNYIAYGLSSLLFSSFLVKKLGAKIAQLLGIALYLPYITSNFYPTWITMIPSAVFRGLGCTLVMAAQATYINESSVLFCKNDNHGGTSNSASNIVPRYENSGFDKPIKTLESDQQNLQELSACHLLNKTHNGAISSAKISMCHEKKESHLDAVNEKINGSQQTAKYQSYVNSTKAFFFGIYGFLYFSAFIWSNLISHYVFKTSEIESYNKTSSCSCGVSFCSSNEECFNNSIEQVRDRTRYLLTSLFVACGVLALFPIFLFLDSMDKAKESVSVSWNHILATVKCMKKKDHLLLIPFTTSTTISRGFYMADFTKSFITCAWSISHVGLITVIYGVASSLSSISSGVLIKYFGRRSVMTLCQIINIANFIFLCLWSPDAQQTYLFYLQGCIFGIIAGIYHTQLRGHFSFQMPPTHIHPKLIRIDPRSRNGDVTWSSTSFQMPPTHIHPKLIRSNLRSRNGDVTWSSTSFQMPPTHIHPKLIRSNLRSRNGDVTWSSTSFQTPNFNFQIDY